MLCNNHKENSIKITVPTVSIFKNASRNTCSDQGIRPNKGLCLGRIPNCTFFLIQLYLKRVKSQVKAVFREVQNTGTVSKTQTVPTVPVFGGVYHE